MVNTVNEREQQDILDGLEKLSAQFSEKLPKRLSEISQYFDENIANKNEHVDALFEMHRLVHALAGTAATYGYKKIGLRLQELDRKLKELSQSFSVSYDGESKKILKNELTSIGNIIQMLRSK